MLDRAGPCDCEWQVVDRRRVRLKIRYVIELWSERDLQKNKIYIYKEMEDVFKLRIRE